MFLRISTLVVMVFGASCMIGDDNEPQAQAVHQDVTGGGGCDEFMCGTNSPQIADFGFWELNFPTVLGTPGLPNNAGMQVLGFIQGADIYLPSVYGGKLTASRTSPADPSVTITISGASLVGGWFYLRNNGRLFKLRVTEVGSVASWAQPATRWPHVMLESYKLDWFELVNNNWGDPRNVCNHPPGRENTDSLSMVGQYAFHTLLFEGDRINASKKLDTDIDKTWVNLGCAGHALAKLALTGHTEAAYNARTFTTTLPERQAMLKLLTADYCGDGTPFTVSGQPLNWRDDRGTMKLAALALQPPQPLVLESRWTENGAACLDRPRVDVHWTPAGDAQFGPDVYHQVQSHCPLQMPPQCADSGFDTGGYHLLSATVPFQPVP